MTKKDDIIQRFKDEVWPLNKQGNTEYTLSEVVRACGKITFDGQEIDIDLIKTRYQNYLKYLSVINADRESRFHTKPEPIGKWLSSKKYDEEYVIGSNHSLDNYLYGE